MNPPGKQDAESLQSALRSARENERRWLEISAEFSSDSERIEQWRGTAKLRRLEIERLETLLADTAAHSSLPKPATGMAIEIEERVGERA